MNSWWAVFRLKTEDFPCNIILDRNGKKLNLKKTYRVVSNSYTVAVSPTNRADKGHSVGITTPDIIKNYLEHQKKISFQGQRCLDIKLSNFTTTN